MAKRRRSTKAITAKPVARKTARKSGARKGKRSGVHISHFIHDTPGCICKTFTCENTNLKHLETKLVCPLSISYLLGFHSFDNQSFITC